jgi:integration host factor subunit beta
MLKSDLVKRLMVQCPHLYERDIEKIVNVILDEIAGALRQGGRVELRGFGAFTARRREARKGRNPRTGAAVSISAKALPFFKTGKEMRQRLNGSGNDMPKGS